MDKILIFRRGFKMIHRQCSFSIEHNLCCITWKHRIEAILVQTVTSVVRNNLDFSQIVVDFKMQRTEPFYTMTLFLPVFILTILAPIGLILPGKWHIGYMIYRISYIITYTIYLSGGYINVGDGFWRRNVLVTTMRCW